MKFLQLLFVPLLASMLFLTASALDQAWVTKAHPAEQGTTSQAPTGYATGTTCPKTGTYRASNQYTEIIIVVAKGKVFPPFSDGTKTIWYALKDN